MMVNNINIRQIKTSEYEKFNNLIVKVYSGLDGFPTQDEHPEYYDTLTSVAKLNEDEDIALLVATSATNEILGGIVYISNMTKYESGSPATQEINTSGIRYLCVDPKFSGMGLGKALTNTCIQLTKDNGHSQVILHTIRVMHVAWKLYEKMGFQRSPDLDFFDNGLKIFGFRMLLVTE